MSPTLYSIYTSDIAINLPSSVIALQYADDIVVYGASDRLKDCRVLVERAVSQIENNIGQLGLDLAPNKSNVVVFNNRDDRENRVKCRIAGQWIGNTRNVKFLGIILDSKLNFNKQLIHVQGRALEAMSILRFCRVMWGMEVSTALQVYKSYVRAILEYGLLFSSRVRVRNK